MGKFADMTGQRIGQLTVLRRESEPGDRRGVVWLCRCDCGKEKGIAASNLRYGHYKTCGCGRFHDLLGKRFGKLTVIASVSRATRSTGSSTRWLCRCDCGTEKIVYAGNLTAKRKDATRSCGCWRRPAGTGCRIKSGYVIVYKPKHPNANARSGLVQEHVVVMSEILGRALLPNERVHHKNGVRDDNRPENLELWVVSQPSGQRAVDLLDWAHEIIDRYGPEQSKLRLVAS